MSGSAIFNLQITPNYADWPSETILNTVNTSLAYGFVADFSGTITKLTVRTGTVSSPVGSTCALYSDVDGKPRVQLSTPVSVPTPLANALLTITGINANVIKDQRYHLMISGPSSGSWTIKTGTDVSMYGVLGSTNNKWNYGRWSSTDGGLTWVTNLSAIAYGFLIEYIDDNQQGYPFTLEANGSAGTDINGPGVQFEIPSGLSIVLAGATFYSLVTGGDLTYKLMRGGILLAETTSVPSAAMSYGIYPLMFSKPQQLDAGIYRIITGRSITLGNGAGGRMKKIIIPVNYRVPFNARYIDESGQVDTGALPGCFSLLLDAQNMVPKFSLNRRQFFNAR